MTTFVSWRYLLIALLAIGLGACGGAAMMKADQEPTIRQGEAMVVFMRSTFVGSAISASVFDVSGPEAKFIGIVNNGTKIAYPVTPRMGVWKARFSFRPVRQNELSGSEFAGWSSSTHFVVNSPETQNWAAQNASDIASKRNQYWPQWNNKPAHDRASQTLNPDDGRL